MNDLFQALIYQKGSKNVEKFYRGLRIVPMSFFFFLMRKNDWRDKPIVAILPKRDYSSTQLAGRRS